MKRPLIIILLIYPLLGFAHKPNEGFFTFSKNELGQITFLAELPWTIRNALIEFNPQLINADSRAFKQSLLPYFEEHFKLHNANGSPIDLISVKEEKVKGHSHQVNLLVTFDADEFYSIQNTVLFNLFENQKNHHYLDLNGQEKYLLLCADNYFWTKGESFHSEEKTNFKILVLIILIVFISILLIKLNKHLFHFNHSGLSFFRYVINAF